MHVGEVKARTMPDHVVYVVLMAWLGGGEACVLERRIVLSCFHD